MKISYVNYLKILFCFVCLSCFSACASQKPINLKIHTDPEGSHVAYSIKEYNSDTPEQWIYLGITPYKGMILLDKDAFDAESKISIKVMQNGYFDQTKEWSGDKFKHESKENSMIFWTPHLVRSTM